MSYKQSFLILLELGLLLFTSCQTGTGEKSVYKNALSFGPGDEAKIVETFLMVKDSTDVLLKAGVYHFDNLSLANVKHIRIRGEGPEKTILDFSSQKTGGEGIRVTALTGFTIDNMTIRDSKGDLIKINKSRDVVVTNLHAVWKTADSTSGGYAIYPVLCKNVLVENCYVEGSSDAGIYVGQSDSAIIRKNKGAKNVAGCEVENTTHAEVYDNEFYNNTAGFLVFDLPGLSQRGGKVKAYNNYIHDNNFRNFAKAGSFGTAWGVGNAPPGSGIIILATSDVELYNNRIINNNTSGIILASGFAVDDSAVNRISDQYFPISSHIKIHGNTFEMAPDFPVPVHEHRMGPMFVAVEQALRKADPKIKRIPFIFYDGVSSNVLKNGTAVNPDSLCIRQSGDNVFVNGDFLNMANPASWKPNTDVAPFVCK
ncbi:parallel beta-helix domain-containing protein [Niabella beijingensis]|uniref:parallel beta-helix domain-containing protein n=1 Tax=Niabella beijingensis TaxID=2872700 RepID=UPI001CBC1459|nr:parallel beta-helix domain-containing protein [Niabella beijingensis]MBZ4191810.1 right-handed parallel beta-helix repeat-containing protein [Niabella beijingensis]